MRLCLIARRFYESNTHMQQFAQALAARGDEVDVIAARRGDLPPYESLGNVNLYRIQRRNIDEPGPAAYSLKASGFLLHALLSVAARHLRRPYDLVHVQSVPDVLVFSALVPKLLGTPVILDLRDLVPELFASKFAARNHSAIFRMLERFEKACARFSDHVIVANPIWLDRIVSRSAPRSKCSMLWYAPDPAVFYPRPRRRRDGKFILMYPGTLSRHQGVDIAVRAFPKIRAAIPEAEFHIYGEGKGRKELEALARHLDLGDAVRFFDFVPTAVLAQRMAETDVAIVPKRAGDWFGNEAASTKIPEFMASGVPVVASRTAIETRLFDDSAICYFRSEDEDDLLRAVVSVYGDPAFRERLCANGVQAVASGARAFQQDYLRLVDTLVSRTVRHAPKPADGEPPPSPVSHPPDRPRGEIPAMIANKAYHAVKPLLPLSLRLALRRSWARSRRAASTDLWPIDPNSSTPPPLWPGWPEGKRLAFVLTHDVEGSKGLSRIQRLMDLDAAHGFRSSFNLVPEGEYRAPQALRHAIQQAGFEVGVHGLQHDGKLYASMAAFTAKAGRINRYLDEWGAAGFRSPLMQHRLSWMHRLHVLYDSSTFDTDPFEPEPDGVGTIFPFWVHGPDGSGYVELPYTLVQDFTLFVVLRERNIEIWKRKLDWLAEHGGMALLNVHPDYMSFEDPAGRDEYPARYYAEFLSYVQEAYGGAFWPALPRDVARFFLSQAAQPEPAELPVAATH
jgi:glycosyltransferase involved in cell wall biosynthesis/peptidoglycan/xylan/chitin deacetylase (PgdA/CDA1 family)